MITIAIVLANVYGGGTKRYTDEIAEAWQQQGHRIIYVQIVERLIHIKIIEQNVEDKNIWFFNDVKLLKLVEFFKSYNVQLIHIQHLFDADINFFNLHKILNIPLVITLHDYYCICPFIKLTDNNDVYCEEKGEETCNSCIKDRNFTSLTFNKNINSILDWRNFWHQYLQESKLIIVPSVDMQKRINKYFPDLPIRIFENPEIIKFNKTKSIGLIGSLATAKGGKKVKECVEYVAKYKIPLNFIVFGEIPEFEFTKEEKQYIKILGRYDEKNIYEIISRYNIDFFWFPGVCLETYSYTLSIPIRLKIPCLSTNLGAIADRIERHKWGKTYSWKADTKEIIDKLLMFNSNEFKNRVFEIKNNSFGNIFEYYQEIELRNNITNDCNNLQIDFNKIPRINKEITKEEFKYLWINANWQEKIEILRWFKFKWIKEFLKKKGLKKFLKKLINYI